MSPLSLVPLLLVLTPPVAAQLRTHTGVLQFDFYGYSVDSAGDVDGDGVPDYVIGSPRTSLFACGGANSYVEVVSGATGLVLHTFDLDVGEHHGALVRGVGDTDGDGHDDLLVANSPDFDCASDLHAYLYSGANGALLHSFFQEQWWELYEFAADKSIAAAGDVDGDGRADIAIGDADVAPGGRVRVHSGSSAALLLEVPGPQGASLGRTCVGVGDWDGDGLDDVAMGGAQGSQVWSVANQIVLFATPFTGALGDPGDHDGDGVRDLLVGGRIVAGATGTLLLDVSTWPVVRMADDLDQDGLCDLVAGDPDFDGGRGRVALLSGAEGSLLVEVLRGEQENGALGFDVAVVGDVTGDGVQDVLVGAPFVGDVLRGAAYLVSGWCPPPPAVHCVGAPNSAGSGARIGHQGAWSVSTNGLVLRTEGCPPAHFGLYFYGASKTQVPFGAGFLCVGPPHYRLWPPVGIDPTGVAARPIDVDAPPLASGAGAATAGSTWNFQFWYRDIPGGAPFFNLSDGLSITFCP